MLSVVRLIGIGTSRPRTWRQHPMLVGPPLGELREIVRRSRRNWCGRCAAHIGGSARRPRRLVIGVAGDVRPLVDEQHARAVLARQPLGEHRAGEARADDQIIIGLFGRRQWPSFCRHSMAEMWRSAFRSLGDQPGHARMGRVPAQMADSFASASASQPPRLSVSASACSQAATKSSAPSAIYTASRSP